MSLLTLVDEYTREALAIKMTRRLNSVNAIEAMADVMLVKGVSAHIRWDNGPEMAAKIIRDWFPRSVTTRCTSKLTVRGRTATASPSTGNSAMNF